MPIAKLDMKQIWNSGKTYEDWLAASNEPSKPEEMRRVFADVPLSPEEITFLKALPRDVYILAIAEDWCGDVRKNVPVIARMCVENPQRLHLRCVEKGDLIGRYLINGAEAIPILVFFNDDFVEIGNWGPRPAECKRLMARAKAAGKVDEARARIHDFYLHDRHRSTVRELHDLIATAVTTTI